MTAKLASNHINVKQDSDHANVKGVCVKDIPSTPHFHCDICKLVLLIQENTKVPLKTMDRLLDWIMKICVLL